MFTQYMVVLCVLYMKYTLALCVLYIKYTLALCVLYIKYTVALCVSYINIKYYLQTVAVESQVRSTCWCHVASLWWTRLHQIDCAGID